MRRFLDALVEPSFRRMPDGRRIVFAWGRRGYEVPSEQRYQVLRRDVRWMTGVGLFGFPPAAFSAAYVGVLPVVAFIALTALCFNLRLAWLLRGLPRSRERQSAAESRALTATALSDGQIWGITFTFLALAAASLALAVAEGEWVFLGAAAACAATAAWIGGGLFRQKRRGERGRS